MTIQTFKSGRTDPGYTSIEAWKKSPRAGVPVSKATVLERETDEAGDLVFTISTAARDRDEDVATLKGWKLDQFVANPVILYAHNYAGLPAAKAKATWIDKAAGKLKSIPVFPSRDVSPSGWEIGELVKAGFLNAASVGFIPRSFEVDEDHRRDTGRIGFKFLEQELLEWSIVPVPANAEALREAKSKGLSIAGLGAWAEQTLATIKGPGVWISADQAVTRSELEAVIKAALPSVIYSIPTAAPSSSPAKASPSSPSSPSSSAPASSSAKQTQAGAPCARPAAVADQVGARVKDGFTAQASRLEAIAKSLCE